MTELATYEETGPSPADLRDLLRERFGRAFELYNAEKQGERENLFALTMSKLGGCTRECAHRLAGTQPSDPELVAGGQQKRPADLGTMQHDGLLPRLAAALGDEADYEVPVELRAGNDRIRGHADLLWRRTLIDLKTTGERKLARVQLDGTYPEHRVQVFGYALAAVQSGYPIENVGWVYMDRATGDDHVVVEPFTRTSAMVVLRRVWEIQHFTRFPDSAPRERRGPGLDLDCDECPFLRRCWGPSARPGRSGPQRILARTNPEVAKWLARYDAARVRASQAEKDKKFALSVIGHRRPGKYGDPDGEHGQWLWSPPREDPKATVDDKDAAVEVLRSREIAVPQRPKKRQMAIRLIEKRQTESGPDEQGS